MEQPSLLDDIISRLDDLPPDVREAVTKDALEATKDQVFIPLPGPQTEAYFSEADVTGFGGNPGGGKSALEIGLALNEHHRSLIVRKKFTDLEGIMDTAKVLVGSSDDFVGGARPKYRKPDGGVIHFAGIPTDGSIGGNQGIPHDLICIDEAAQFAEDEIRILLGWLRTDKEGQRCRVVMGSNPPLDTVGDWMVPYFAPWLDETHPNPAEDGELRYFKVNEDGDDEECEPDDYTMFDGVKVYPQSRTFITSKFTDNPYYDAEEYAKTLAALPSEIRDILRTGDFMLAREDNPLQAIPTAWVKEAMARWEPKPPNGVPMCAMGVDVAGGGKDDVALAPRWDGYFGELIVEPGKDFKYGKGIAGLVITHRRDDARIIVDMGGGYGNLPYDQLKANSIDVVPYMGVEKTKRRSKDGKLKYFNTRTAAYWGFREALDPEQPGGSHIVLPNDRELLSDLTSPMYSIDSSGIKLESKVDLVKRLKRSTNRGDAVVMSWFDGPKAISHRKQWAEQGIGRPGGRVPKVVMKRRKR